MKKSFVLPVITGLLGLMLLAGCPKNDKLAELEARVGKLEKRLQPRERAEPPQQTAAYQIPTGSSFVLGEKKAPVSVVIFSDYQCPYCASTDPFLQKVVADAGLKGKVNVVFKHFPLSFHKQAKSASKAAMAAGEQGHDKFWAMSEKLYGNQRDLTAENFNKWAKEIGLNVAKFKADLKKNDAKYEEMIKNDMELGIKQAKVRGTPSIYVGGWELKKRSIDGIKELIKDKKLL